MSATVGLGLDRASLPGLEPDAAELYLLAGRAEHRRGRDGLELARALHAAAALRVGLAELHLLELERRRRALAHDLDRRGEEAEDRLFFLITIV